APVSSRSSLTCAAEMLIVCLFISETGMRTAGKSAMRHARTLDAYYCGKFRAGRPVTSGFRRCFASGGRLVKSRLDGNLGRCADIDAQSALLTDRKSVV